MDIISVNDLIGELKALEAGEYPLREANPRLDALLQAVIDLYAQPKMDLIGLLKRAGFYALVVDDTLVILTDAGRVRVKVQ